MAQGKGTKEEAPSVGVVWKLAQGERIDIPNGSGMFRVTDEDLKSEAVIAALTRIEQARGMRIFGTVVVKG